MLCVPCEVYLNVMPLVLKNLAAVTFFQCMVALNLHDTMTTAVNIHTGAAVGLKNILVVVVGIILRN